MIGSKNQPITIERRIQTRTLSGGFADDWATWASVWASVKAKSGRESLDEGRVNATFVVVFTVYNLAVRDDDRIVWNGVRYNIRGILREGASPLDLRIEAERGVAS